MFSFSPSHPTPPRSGQQSCRTSKLGACLGTLAAQYSSGQYNSFIRKTQNNPQNRSKHSKAKPAKRNRGRRGWRAERCASGGLAVTPSFSDTAPQPGAGGLRGGRTAGSALQRARLPRERERGPASSRLRGASQPVSHRHKDTGIDYTGSSRKGTNTLTISASPFSASIHSHIFLEASACHKPVLLSATLQFYEAII